MFVDLKNSSYLCNIKHKLYDYGYKECDNSFA